LGDPAHEIAGFSIQIHREHTLPSQVLLGGREIAEVWMLLPDRRDGAQLALGSFSALCRASLTARPARGDVSFGTLPDFGWSILRDPYRGAQHRLGIAADAEQQIHVAEALSYRQGFRRWRRGDERPDRDDARSAAGHCFLQQLPRREKLGGGGAEESAGSVISLAAKS
jgi:hypothetical protein